MCDELLLEQLKSLIENERNVIANLANASALLHLSLEEINWAGFYLAEGEELTSAPFRESLPASASPLERGSAALRRRRTPYNGLTMCIFLPGISPVTALPMQRL